LIGTWLRHDTTRHDTTRHDTTRHDTTRHDTTNDTTHDTTRVVRVLGADAGQVALSVVAEAHPLRHDVVPVLLKAGPDEVWRVT
jgi:hypothetical protein